MDYQDWGYQLKKLFLKKMINSVAPSFNFWIQSHTPKTYQTSAKFEAPHEQENV